MIQTYKCTECDEVFEEPKRITEDLTPGGSFEGGRFNYTYTVCPHCNGEYEEAFQCFSCGEYFRPDELTDMAEVSDIDYGYMCEQCLKDSNIKIDEYL